MSSDVTIIVTEEQVVAVRNGSEVFKNHSHSIHATISKDFIVTVDDQRKLNIFSIAKVKENEFQVSRQFQLPNEVHSMSVVDSEESQYLVLNFWNTQTVDLYSIKDLLESTSNSFLDNQIAKVNVEDYAPFTALDIDQVHVFTLAGSPYLIVTLSNGYVLGLNLYPNALKAPTANSTELQIVRLSTVFKCGNIVEVISKLHEDAILLTSDSASFILSVDKSPKSGHFNDLIVLPLRDTRAH